MRVSDNQLFDYLMQNHYFRVYFDLTWTKGINKYGLFICSMLDKRDTLSSDDIEEICKEAVHREPYTLSDVPDHFMTQKMCIKAECKNPAVFFLVPDRFKTQEMCEKSS